MLTFLSIPDEVKELTHLLKLADEYEEEAIVVSYWARMSACILAFCILPDRQSPETAELLSRLYDWLDEAKKANQDNEAIMNETKAQILIEEDAMELYEYAEKYDKAQIFNRNTIKTFYTASLLMDVLEQFGYLSVEMKEKRNYAKWKAMYIHNCLKVGERPLSGPPTSANDNDSAIAYNSIIPEEEFDTYTKYIGFINLDSEEMNEPFTSKPISPNTTLEPNFDLNVKLDDFTHEPVVPQDPPATSLPKPTSSQQVTSSLDQMQKAQMYCEFAICALKYHDVGIAAENLHNALNLLKIESIFLQNKI